PYFDLSLADVVTWKTTAWLELGAGVNFHRLLPRNAPPGRDCDNTFSNYTQVDPASGDGDNCFIADTVAVTVGGVDTVRIDTVTGGLQGIKAMARFRVDPKVLFGMRGVGPLAWGEQDLVVYGAAAVLGFKDYPRYHEGISEPIPAMLVLHPP